MQEVKVEKLLGKTEAQTKEEYKNFALGKVKKKFIYSLLNGGLSPDKIKEGITKTVANGYSSILVQPLYVATVASLIKQENLKVGVVIGYPFGENTLDAIVCQAKKWAKSIIDEIVVALPISDIKFNKCKITEKILKKLHSVSKKKTVSVMFDAYKLNDAELAKVSKEIVSHKINTAYISTGYYKEVAEDRAIIAIKNARKTSNPYICYSGEIADTASAMGMLEKCDYVLSDKADEFIEQIKNKIEV